MEQRHVISVLVENKPGVLARVAGMFSGRAFNIHSLAVAPTMDSKLSRMTIVTLGSEQLIEQILKQLRKLINVLKVQDLTEGEFVEREMVLIRVKAPSARRTEILRINEVFRGKVIDMGRDNLTLEATGSQSKIQALLDLLAPFGIQEVMRTGAVAIPRARKS